MFKIKDNLATHGVDWFTGHPFEGWEIIDARVLREADEPNPNPPELYLKLIHDSEKHLKEGKNVVIYCSGGASRSNSIALGVLIDYFKMNFYDALSLIEDKVPVCQIEDIHINMLKKMFNVGPP